MILTKSEEKSKILLKKTWEGCNCQVSIKLKRVIKTIIDGMINNC